MHAFPFLSQTTFLKCPPAGLLNFVPTSASAVPFAVCGVAWDGCVSNRPGARFGPAGIRTASHMLCDGVHPDFDVTPHDPMSAKFGVPSSVPHTHNDRVAMDKARVADDPAQSDALQGTRHNPLLVDYGDLELPNCSLSDMRGKMSPAVEAILSRGHESVLWLGGDHSITLGLLRAYRSVRPTEPPLAVLHFDAHCDTWLDHFGEASGHGTWVSEAITEGIADPKSFVQVGIRSSADREAREYVNTAGGAIHTAKSLRGLDGEGLRPVVDSILARWKAQGNPPVYITLDIDCLDPAFAPGTGTPEPGGLMTSQALTILEEVLRGADPATRFVGMDVVEVAPAYDHAELTTNAAATLGWPYLCGVLWRRNNRAK